MKTMNLKKGELYLDDLGFFIMVDICTKNKPLYELYKHLHCKYCYRRKDDSFYKDITMYLIYSFKKNMLNSHYSCITKGATINVKNNRNNKS
ncbi:hypothetical protein M0R19_03840 [Candidatus Pacearchaeota archaeon]|jgi:hypothetical protein|nr:hypothetical protein [Candidatus Pacearchaeota archaeon]